MAFPRTRPRRFQPRLFVGRGTRATESFLLDELDRVLAEAEGDPALLARPVRVVVPSRSLRLHLGTEVARQRGRSAAGLLIQTHYHLALEVIERAGEPLRPGRWIGELLPERRAREQRVLARPLEELVDGFTAVVATVRDLLDARFEPALFEGIDEALATDGPTVATRRQVARARALLEVARETHDEIETAGLGSTARLLTRAAELLEARGETLLPSRAVLLHGYADATGVVTDLLQALQRRFGAWVLLDRPPDPATAGEEGPGRGGVRTEVSEVAGRFGEEFVERLSQAASPEAIPVATAPETSQRPRIDLFTAQGVEGEVREVAQRIAALPDRTRPESIAVVARDPTPYRREIRRRLGLLGIPFSALGEGGAPTPEERPSRALLELLRRGPRSPTERWIEASERLSGGNGEVFGSRALMDLRLGLAALGAARLGDVARLDVAEVLGDRKSLPLPVRQGIRGVELAGADEDPADETTDTGKAVAAGADPGVGAPVRLLRRTLGRSVLEAAVAAARRLRTTLDRWPPTATPEEHRRRVRSLVVDELGWRIAVPTGSEDPGICAEASPGSSPLLDALTTLDAEAPEGFEIGFDEMQRLLARILDARPGSPLGGRGGGIQVLSVTEARGRTFDHLFLLGCNRGVFPRPIREDPLLPDALRRVLRRVLPDTPIKSSGFDEERYLFAQLLSSAPRVTLSWQHLDDTGAVRPPSPLVERLRLRPENAGPTGEGRTWEEPPRAQPAWAVPVRSAVLRPVVEAATLVALHGPRSAFRAVLPHAVRGEAPVASVPPQRLTTARLALLDEMDPDLSTPEGRAAAARLGPFFGFVGGPVEPDPRHRDLWVTTVERLAGCPWQVFLTRLLGLEPTPDPLAALPGIDPLLLGRAVHGALEDLVGFPEDHPARRDTVEGLRSRSPVRPPWPDDQRLDELLSAAAEEVLRDEGLALPGLTRALARAARPCLDAARKEDWAAGPPPVVGVETVGALAVHDGDGRERLLRFRADRVDRETGGPGDDTLVLTDYKTGRPPRGSGGNEGRRETTRRRYLLEDVRTGARLQAVAYALAGGTGAVGRYLFLRPDTEFRDRSVGPDDEDFQRDFVTAFHDAVGAGLGVWDTGAFFPRVVDPLGEEEPVRCSWCPVAEACIRGDSGARLRLAKRSRRQGRRSGDPAEAALLAVWWLGEEPPSATGEPDPEEGS